MIIIWGKKLYGKVDRSEGEFYVKTEFGHLWYIPLVPTKSWVILEGSEDGDGWQGVPISMSWKSVFVAWLRALFVLAAILGIGAAFSSGIAFSEGYGSVTEVAVGVGGLILPIALYFGLGAVAGTAGPERRRQLAETLGIGELPPDQIGYRPLGGGG